MAINVRPGIVTNGLVLALDAANPRSYPKSGTTWRDLSGNNNSGSLVNGPTFNSLNAGSITFDGTNDYILTATGSQMPLNFTIDFWVRPGATQVQYADIWGNHGQKTTPPTSSWGVVMQQDFNNTNIFGWGWGYGVPKDFSSSPYFYLPPNVWRNVTSIKNGVNGSTYTNGALINTFVASFSSIGLSPSNFMIGNGQYEDGTGLGTRYFNGSIACFRLYNRALSAQEVQQNYIATKARFGL